MKLFGVQANFANHLSAIPNGFYKDKIKVYDESDDNIFTLQFVVQVYKSDLRDWK
jgi:hypothetical protein